MSYFDFDMLLAAVVYICALPCALPMTEEFKTATPPPSRSRPVATPILTRMPEWVARWWESGALVVVVYGQVIAIERGEGHCFEGEATMYCIVMTMALTMK